MSFSLRNLCAGVPQRRILAFMCFLGLFNAFSMRSCLSIAITEMVVPIKEVKNITDYDNCPSREEKTFTNVTKVKHFADSHGTFEWDEYIQGLILSSFYWGYVVAHVPGGLISEKFGGKHVFGNAILLNAVLTLVTPTAIYWGDYTALIFLRVLVGLSQGVIYPSINILLAQWIPLEERSRTASFVFAGALMGTLYSMVVSGWILRYSAMGWPLVFYTFGIISIIWFIVWLVACYKNPRDHPFITKLEIDYLKERMSEHTRDTPPRSVPWRHILTSKSVWALIVAQAGFSASILTFITDLPKYMSGVLKFSVEYNGYFTALIYLSMCIGGNVSSWIADYFISKKNIFITTVRRGMCVVALPVSASFVIAASYAGCDRVLAVGSFVAALTTMGAAYPSVMVNTLDLSPNYAGTLTGVTNGLATSTGIVSPILIGILAPNQTLPEWRTVFWIIFVVSVASNIVFLVFGSGEVQYWNDPDLVKKKSQNLTGKYRVRENTEQNF